MKKTPLALAVLFSLILAGCGGSGGSNRRPETPPQAEQPIDDEKPIDDSEKPDYSAAVEAAKTIEDPIGTLKSTLALEMAFTNASGIEPRQLRVDGQVVPDAPYRFSNLQNGLNTLPIEVDYGPVQGNQNSGTLSGNLFIYEQPYSMVLGSVYMQDSGNGADDDYLNVYYVDFGMGLMTESAVIDTLSTAGLVATYSGHAFNGKEQGNLSYEMNFGNRRGSGEITGLTESGKVDLLPASIINSFSNNFIFGLAQTEKAPNVAVPYQLGFYGPNAEEIVGGVFIADDPALKGASDISFAGKRPMP